MMQETKVIIHQSGSRVLFTRICGLLILLYAIATAVGGLAAIVWAAATYTFDSNTAVGVFISLIQAVAFAWPAVFLLWIYPDIEIGQDAVRLHFLMFQQRIARESLLRIAEQPLTGEYVLLLKKSRALLNLLYGCFFLKRSDQAVVLLSIDDDSLNRLKNYLSGSSGWLNSPGGKPTGLRKDEAC